MTMTSVVAVVAARIRKIIKKRPKCFWKRKFATKWYLHFLFKL